MEVEITQTTIYLDRNETWKMQEFLKNLKPFIEKERSNPESELTDRDFAFFEELYTEFITKK